MNILGYTLSKQKEQTPIKTVVDSFNSFEFSRPELPDVIETRNNEWVNFGSDNLYPQFLKELMQTSSMHSAIIQGKSKMMSGSGFLLNGASNKVSSQKTYDALDAVTKSAYDQILLNKEGQDTLKDIINKICLDYQIHSMFAVEIVWSLDFSRIALIKYVDVSTIRSGKMVNGKVSDYFYSRDWTKFRQDDYTPKRIPAFDPNNRTDYSQLIFVKSGAREYYGVPSYEGALSWVKIESQLGLFHLSNLENGFAPSLWFSHYKVPSNPEEKQQIVTNIKKQFGGAKNAGKALVTFSDGKELAMDIRPIEVANLDKQFIALADQAVQNILSGHRVTSPLLFGISVAGSLGANNELQTAFKIFDGIVIEPDRQVLERTLNTILKASSIDVKIEIDRFNPLADEETSAVSEEVKITIDALNSLSPLIATKVLNTMSADEIRALVNLKPGVVPAVAPTNNLLP